MRSVKNPVLYFFLAVIPSLAVAQTFEKYNMDPIRLSGDRRLMNELQRNGTIRTYRETSPGEFLVTGAVDGKSDGAPSRQFHTNPEAGKPVAVITEDPSALLELLRIRLRHRFNHRIDPVSGTLLITLSHPADADILSSCEGIMNILPAESGAIEETAIVESDLSVNKIDLMKAETGLKGEGNAVSVKEKRFPVADPDLKGRIFASPDPSALFSSHAAQMATLIAGAGNSNYTAVGAAPGSMVTSSGFEDLFADDLRGLPFRVGVQNHSYGTGAGNFYGAEARSYDLATNADPFILHVFSSGNSGTADGTGRYANIPGYSNLTGNFKMAKNTVVTGSHDRDHSLDERNSSGPAYDGRIKPELVAFGADGTSDAAALVSGAALLLQQINVLPNGAKSPSALIKAALIAGADDLGSPGPDFKTGFGALNGSRSAQLLSAGQVFHGTVGANEQLEFRIDLSQDLTGFSAVLVWNDPAAQAGDINALINDLDLSVTAPDQLNWYPWSLSSFPNLDSLRSQPVRKPDHLNNIEQISIPSPIAGTYVLRVVGRSLATQHQDFFIVWRKDHAGYFRWTNPFTNAAYPNGDPFFLRWETTITGLGSIQVRSAGAASWTVLDPAVDLSSGFYRPDLPEEPMVLQFRMLIDSKSFESPLARMDRQMAMRVLYNCEEEAGFSWAPRVGASAYRVLKLGERYMEPVTTITDTLYRISSAPSVTLYKVQPLFPDGTDGPASPGLDPAATGVNCYYSNFSVLPEDSGNASIILLLTFRSEIKTVILEKSFRGTFQPISEQQPTGDLIRFFDRSLQGGVSYYRARLKREGKPDILTYEAELLFADATTCLVFPNPASPGESITVLTNGDELEITFFDPSGKRMESMELVGQVFRPEIRFDAVPGLYLYQVRRRGKQLGSGRLLVAPR